MSISELVPKKEREKALLEEIFSHLGPASTGKIVGQVINRFRDRLTPLEITRTTPSGTPWWPGRFRFDIDALKKRGIVRSPEKGYWELTEVQKPTLSKHTKKTLDRIERVIKAIRSGEVKALISVTDGKFTIELSEQIIETRLRIRKRQLSQQQNSN